MRDLAELTQRFSAFAETSAKRAPLYSALSRVVAKDETLAGLLGAAPDEQHNPVLLFAAVHVLVPLAELELEVVGPLALVEVGASAGLNLLLTHYSYEFQPG